MTKPDLLPTSQTIWGGYSYYYKQPDTFCSANAGQIPIDIQRFANRCGLIFSHIYRSMTQGHRLSRDSFARP